MKDSTISDCAAKRSGGGIYLDAKKFDLLLENTKFTGNAISQRGLASRDIYIRDVDDLKCSPNCLCAEPDAIDIMGTSKYCRPSCSQCVEESFHSCTRLNRCRRSHTSNCALELNFFNYGSEYKYQENQTACFVNGRNRSSACLPELERLFSSSTDGAERCLCHHLYAPKAGGKSQRTVYQCAEKQKLIQR